MTGKPHRSANFWSGLIAPGLLALLAFIPSSSGHAADAPVTLKLSNWIPPTHIMQKAWIEWAEDIKHQSGGTIGYVNFPAEQLGKAFDHYDMARDGIADFAFVNAGYQPGRFPVSGAGELPFLFSNGVGGTAALDGWYRKYAAKEMADVHFCYAFTYDPVTLMSRGKIVTPADMNGLKVRPSNATLGSFDKLLGATNIQASAPAARDLLDRKTADAVTTPWHSAMVFGYEKVAQNALDLKLGVSVLVWVMNKAKYDGMSPSQKKVIDDHCNTEWALKMAMPWAEYEAEGKPMFASLPGHVVTTPTPEQVELWRKAAEPLVTQWEATVQQLGYDPKAVLSELKDQLVRHQAAY